MMTYDERAAMMVQIYGEVCKRAEAVKILGVSAKTVAGMLDDGRLDWACAGTMVDVRSIARYITAPKQADFEAANRRRRARTGCDYYIPKDVGVNGGIV